MDSVTTVRSIREIRRDESTSPAWFKGAMQEMYDSILRVPVFVSPFALEGARKVAAFQTMQFGARACLLSALIAT